MHSLSDTFKNRRHKSFFCKYYDNKTQLSPEFTGGSPIKKGIQLLLLLYSNNI